MVVVLAWTAMRRTSFERGLAAVLVGGILVAPHVYLSDCAMTLPALLMTMPLMQSQWQRGIHYLLFSLPCFIWALTGPAWVTSVALIAYLVSIAFAARAVRRPVAEDAEPEFAPELRLESAVS